MRWLKYLGIFVVLAAVVAAVAWVMRTDPIGPVAGKRLTGEERPFAEVMDVINDHLTCAVETRPDNPHSVTTICFIHDGKLTVPAMDGSTKTWPKYAIEDPRVRIKVGDYVYPAKAERVTGLEVEDVLASLTAKYPQYGDRDPEEVPEDVWVFVLTAR